VGVSALGLSYVAGIVATVKVVAAPKQGAPERRMSVKELALTLPKHAWRTITWREGTNERLRSRFARVRVRTAPIRGAAQRAEETLLIEWPEGEREPTKYWLSRREMSSTARCNASPASAVHLIVVHDRWPRYRRRAPAR
jgi:SRSO17 transposase